VTDLSKKQRAGAAIAAAVLVAAPLTASFEGLRTKPYHDPGDGRATVCYGETEREMRVYTADECQVLLVARQQRDYAPAVLKCVPAIGSKPKIFAASIDAAYNTGTAAFCRSPIAKRFNAGAWIGGCGAFHGWYTTAKGKPLPGLVRRRAAEQTLCLEGAMQAKASRPWGWGTDAFDGWPPQRYTKNTSTYVYFATAAQIAVQCSDDGKPDPNIEACSSGPPNKAVMPNPCIFPAADNYARLLCHEIGHLNGWANNHPR
jgi:lysozyme